jgi:hypothetical protein
MAEIQHNKLKHDGICLRDFQSRGSFAKRYTRAFTHTEELIPEGKGGTDRRRCLNQGVMNLRSIFWLESWIWRRRMGMRGSEWMPGMVVNRRVCGFRNRNTFFVIND